MNDYCMIETAFDNKEEVEKVVNGLLDKKLVSGCQVVKSESTWNWKNEREGTQEFLVFMKTKKSNLKEIYEFIKTIHSYECFEFATFDITSINKDYLKWIDDETTK